jgi:hypothetical protein
MTNVTIGPYADPPQWDRYFIKSADGRRIERTHQKLANGGYHYIDIDCSTCEWEEWFEVPDEEGVWHDIYPVS